MQESVSKYKKAYVNTMTLHMLQRTVAVRGGPWKNKETNDHGPTHARTGRSRLVRFRLAMKHSIGPLLQQTYATCSECIVSLLGAWKHGESLHAVTSHARWLSHDAAHKKSLRCSNFVVFYFRSDDYFQWELPTSDLDVRLEWWLFPMRITYQRFRCSSGVMTIFSENSRLPAI